MHLRSIGAALAALLALSPVARADEPASPEHRVDLVGPTLGVGYFASLSSEYSDGIFSVSGEARYAHASGHGAMLRFAWGSNVWGEGYGVELDYLFRSILTGHRDLSLGLDFTLGASLATLEHDEQMLAVGAHLGGNAGLSLDLRAYNFVLSLAGQYRVLVPTEDRLDGEPGGPAHALTATLGAGVSFY